MSSFLSWLFCYTSIPLEIHFSWRYSGQYPYLLGLHQLISSHVSFFQGTVIRVYSIPDGQKLYEFRRGVKRYRAKDIFIFIFFFFHVKYTVIVNSGTQLHLSLDFQMCHHFFTGFQPRFSVLVCIKQYGDCTYF